MLANKSRGALGTRPETNTGAAPFDPRANWRLIETQPKVDAVEIFQELINGLPEQAALVDMKSGTILAVNEAWEETVTLNGLSDFKPGKSYFAEIAKLAASGNRPAQSVLQAVEEMRLGRRTSFRLVYEGGGRQAGQKFEARIAVLNVSGHKYMRITRYDVTELALLRSMQADHSASLMHAQENERRRMGRELHDSGMQLLASLGLALARLKHFKTEAELASVTQDMQGLLLEVQREFRSISFLAHPPQVEQLGLVEALRVLVEGFGDRAALATTFTVEGEVAELSADASHTFFRVVQEALSNVHRHAHASSLAVKVIGRKGSLHVVVADDGRGIPADHRHGVGLLGMRARIGELGGRLSIRDGSPGAVIIASMPIPPRERPQ